MPPFDVHSTPSLLSAVPSLEIIEIEVVLRRFWLHTSASAESLLAAPLCEILRLPRRGAPRRLTHDLLDPAQLRSDLHDPQAQHPHRLMKPMTHFLTHRQQDLLPAGEFAFQKFLSPPKLLQKHPRAALPR